MPGHVSCSEPPYNRLNPTVGPVTGLANDARSAPVPHRPGDSRRLNGLTL